jgi:hypothetical protein
MLHDLDLPGIVDDFAHAIAVVDARGPVGAAKRFKPGVGPLTETELTDAILTELRGTKPGNYGWISEGAVRPTES